ncbi:G-protein coupled receptor dmsr-1-like [Aricia agestis]|uniref:G-protein coupled receptor dmsr-1-like n=1 Tax=Aricia agestis TaxID=91739 RepID=UPI001C2047E7|nr:G-protein coupled receptor dmsr-1-like [Aricia agestis]XP_041977333.1 G-protein coupled receptor dmsr-1-like [Aricia agestis]
MANATDALCVPGASDFNRAYSRLHGYIAIVICIIGSTTNTINITVLSRREMISTTNSILTGLAVADLLVMLEYIPYALHMNIKIGPQVNKNTYTWAVFVYFHSIFSQTFHTISIWLAVTLAVWRYIAIAYPQRNRTWCSRRNTTAAIVGAYVICPVLCLPIYFAMNIVENEVTRENNTEFAEDLALPHNRTVYVLEMSKNKELVTAIMWIYSVILKLVPSIALSVLSTCLISKLSTTERKRQRLLKRSTLERHEPEKQTLSEEASARRTSRTDRTTRMLLAVLGLFLSTEVPQGLLGLASALAPEFFKSCYSMFGDLMDVLALFTSSVNFVLYCSMSRQFRCTFARLARRLMYPAEEPVKLATKLEPTTQVTGPL